jgi:IS1 family transposase
MSLRGLQRVAGLPSLQDTLLPAQAKHVLEMDELVSVVSQKGFKRWLWLAMCRRTRQLGAYAIGDRSETTARKLWQTVPAGYRSCPVYTDEYDVYALIIPSQEHRAAPKEAHQTNQQERWNNTLRQWLGRYTRKTLSFSKEDTYHTLVAHWFIIEHNLRIQASRTL